MKVIRWIDAYLEEAFMMVFLIVIVVSMSLQVIMRYIVGYSLSWPEEVSRYSFVWLSYLGLSYAVKVNASLKIDILHTLFPKIKTPLNVLGDMVYMGFCIVLIKPGMITLLKIASMGSRSAAISMPMWLLYLSLLLGAILTCFRMVEKYVLKIHHCMALKRENQNADDQTGKGASN